MVVEELVVEEVDVLEVDVSELVELEVEVVVVEVSELVELDVEVVLLVVDVVVDVVVVGPVVSSSHPGPTASRATKATAVSQRRDSIGRSLLDSSFSQQSIAS